MIFDKAYNDIADALSNNICGMWPEQSFVAASWLDLARNIENVYKGMGTKSRGVPHSVRIGHMDDTPEGMGLARPSGAYQLAVPLMFDWCAFRGLCLSAFDASDAASAMYAVNQVGSSMLLRMLLHADEGKLLIHKVDPKGLGKSMDMIPQQPEAPIIVDKEGVGRLIAKLRAQISSQPVDALTWRCDEVENPYVSDSQPLQIIFIANWSDLSDVRMGQMETSEVQRSIVEMLHSDVPARNGIYFFICSTEDEYERNFSHSLPVLDVSAGKENHTGSSSEYCAQLFSLLPRDNQKHRGLPIEQTIYRCRVSLPGEANLLSILKAYRNHCSGMLLDEDSDGVWKGNSAQGLRAVMGMTPQGENQFFELGIGQGSDAFHALIGGATGSGKSVLLSEIVCSLAERYSPIELRMLLLDYKEGTEFAPFAGLPHVYALSMGSNPEFGLEVLKEVQKEIARRGQLFKEAGNAKNLDEYRRFSGKKLCRYVLVADEFQVLLGDKKYGEEAKVVLNDLVRRGRSFGFHAILATQTLRDGALDGEAKNQFGCRIAMRMAESETDYFLSSGNVVPASFNRKGQALVNYALGRKESNIIFQSGNKNMSKGYRDTSEILSCVELLHKKAVEENCLPSDVYIYNSDGYAQLSQYVGAGQQGVLIGLRNDMQGTPVSLSPRQLSGKVLILGENKTKQRALLSVMTTQLGALYNESVRVQTPADYLDYPSSGQVTILEVPEGDFDFEEAILEWKEQGELMQPPAMMSAMPSNSAFVAPAGMESEFAELMQSMQNNQAAMNMMPSPARSRRNRDTRCLIVAVGTAADLKLMEAGGMYVNDFRTIIYTDHVIYNQVSGNYENSPLGEAAAFLESPRGVVTKIRLFK